MPAKRFEIVDAAFLLGAALALGGIGCIYWPAALITAGVSIMLVAVKLWEKDKERK